MIKRALTATLCLMLVFALLPKTARADSPMSVFIGGEHAACLDSDYPYYVNGIGRKARENPPDAWNAYYSYDAVARTNTLTLNGLTVTNSSERDGTNTNYGIDVFSGSPSDTLTIKLEGTNIVSTAHNPDQGCAAVSAACNIVIKGDGSLAATGGNATAGNSYGVYTLQNLSVECGSITGTGGEAKGLNGCSYGVYSASNITVTGGSITGTGGTTNSNRSESNGVYAGAGITMNGGSITGTGGTTNGDSSSSFGVHAKSGNIEANGGSITGTGGTTDNSSIGVFAEGSWHGSITIDGGSIVGIGGIGKNISYGVSSWNSLTLIDGRLVGTTEAGGMAVINVKFQTTYSYYYWRLSINDGYTRSSTDPYPWEMGQSYAEICTSLPTPPSIAVSVPTFGAGQAPSNEAVTVAFDKGINATNNFGSATMDGAPIDLGTVGAPGAHGSVRNGSIVIQLNKAYLDTLAVGTHTLRVNLAGFFVGQHVEAQITVLPTADGVGEAGADVPKTGDGATPALWLGLMLLAGAGLAVSVARRKRRNG